MRKLRYHLVDVFTNERFGGNPLAVFTNGRGLPDSLMRQIAKELNLSETTFVLPPEDPANHWRIRIFTPATELPMAGHPTIGTSAVLAQEQLVQVSEAAPTIRLEEKVGVIPVTFEFAEGAIRQIMMQQPAPEFGPLYQDRAALAGLLSLAENDLADLPCEVVSCGVPFLFIPIRTLDAIRRIRLRTDVWERLLQNFVAPHVFVFTTETERPGSTVHSRMFAPAMGIAEDPATGGASGPLGSYLVRHGLVTENPAAIISEQGLEIGRPSFIHIRIGQTGGQITQVQVGGQSGIIGEGLIEV